PPKHTLFPYTTLFRSINEKANENPSCDIGQFSREIPKPNRQWREQKQYHSCKGVWIDQRGEDSVASQLLEEFGCQLFGMTLLVRSEEHTSELQSRGHL